MNSEQSERINALRARLRCNSSTQDKEHEGKEGPGSTLHVHYIDFSGANFSGCTFTLGPQFNEEPNDD